MTAVFAGFLVVAGAFWAAEQIGAIDPPKPTWQIAVDRVEGKFTPGEDVSLVNDSDPLSPPVSVGTAKVVSYIASDQTAGQLVIGQIQLNKDQAVGSASTVKSTGPNAARGSFGAGGAMGIASINMNAVRFGVATALIVLGFILIYWLIGRRESTVDFLIHVDDEMKKVNWSSKRVIRESTVVVIIATFLLAGVLFVFDIGFQGAMRAVGILK